MRQSHVLLVSLHLHLPELLGQLPVGCHKLATSKFFLAPFRFDVLAHFHLSDSTFTALSSNQASPLDQGTLSIEEHLSILFFTRRPSCRAFT